MKIKNVVLKAFRLFDDENLDFINHSKGRTEAANLVAIHAPNGFGKTSFFDAIEFAVTKNIKRLKRDETIFKENVKHDKASDNSSFIHNSKLKDKQLEVRVDFDGDLSFERHPEKDEESTWLLGEPENEFFSTVMLAQDWFSAFLSTTNGEERFRMFLDNFVQTKGLLEYHSMLKSTSISLNRSVKAKEREVNNLEKELKDAIDDDIKERLREAVLKLKMMGIDLKWDGHINDRSLTAIDLEAGQMAEMLKSELQTLKGWLQHGEDVREEHDNLMAINDLPVHKERISTLKKSIQRAQEILKQVLRLKEVVKQIAEHDQERQKLFRDNERLKNLILKHAAFVILEQRRLDYEKEIQQIGTAIELETKALSALSAEQQQHQTALEQAKLITLAAQNKVSSLEEKYKKYEALQNEDKELVRVMGELTQKNGILNKEKEDLTKKEQRIQDIVAKINSRTLNGEVEDYKELSSAIITLAKRIKSTSLELTTVQKSIEEQQRYMGQVEQLVAKSREMADTLNTGDCPLCGHHYESVDALLRSIEENKAISAVTDALIARKKELNKRIEEDSAALEAAYTQMEMVVNNDLKSTREKEAAKDKEIAAIVLQINGKTQRQTELRQDVENNYAMFRDMSLEQLKIAYQQEQDNAEKQQKEREDALTASNKKMEDTAAQIKKHNEQMASAASKSKQITEDEDYIAYKLLLNGEAFDEDAYKAWEAQKEANKVQMAQREQKINELNVEQKKLRDEEHISEAMEPELQVNIEAQKKEFSALKERYVATVRFLSEECAVKDIETSMAPAVIVEKFEQAMQSHQNNKRKAEDRQNALIRFNALNLQAKKYWEQQKTRKQLVSKKKELSDETNNQQLVKDETERLQDFLTKYVRDYFHLELINKLYNTIDPHPVYKNISFECDFSTSRPKLNVYMRAKRDDEGDIVPNLYFSTAQINILSFCIFMAKALFAHTNDKKDIGCIFIDDPIQALDDINILSMIDMLRNVAFTQDRQIILTTHDRNFFELLQRKMPQEKFNACYFRLKERGKFEQVV